jgi:hypothetical protein
MALQHGQFVVSCHVTMLTCSIRLQLPPGPVQLDAQVSSTGPNLQGNPSSNDEHPLLVDFNMC